MDPYIWRILNQRTICVTRIRWIVQWDIYVTRTQTGTEGIRLSARVLIGAYQPCAAPSFAISYASHRVLWSFAIAILLRTTLVVPSSDRVLRPSFFAPFVSLVFLFLSFLFQRNGVKENWELFLSFFFFRLFIRHRSYLYIRCNGDNFIRWTDRTRIADGWRSDATDSPRCSNEHDTRACIRL